jgi:hypothetical protein
MTKRRSKSKTLKILSKSRINRRSKIRSKKGTKKGTKNLRISSRRSSRRSLKKILLNTAGIIGTGLVVKKLRTDYNKRVVYEEDKLISDYSAGIINPIDAKFKVRSINPDIKQETSDSLYTTYKVEILKGNNKFSKIASKKSLPDITNNTKLPSYFIVNAILPPLEGINFSFVIYYKIKPSTIDAYNNPNSNPILKPAIKLLENFTNDYSNYRDRFKGIASILTTDSLNIGSGGKWVISKSGLTDQKSTILNKTVEKYQNGKIFEVDIDSTKFNIPSWMTPFISLDTVTKYYDKTQNFKMKVGFVIEGGPSKKHDNERTHTEESELPEVLLGGSEFSGFEMVSADTTKNFVGHPDKIIEIENIIDEDPKTMEMGMKYEDYIKTLIDDIKLENISLELLPLPKRIKDSRSKSSNKKFFLFARYFYYLNLSNKEFELSSNYLTYSAAPSHGLFSNHSYIAKGTCFGNDKIFNLYQCTNGSFQTYRFGFSIKNAFDNTDFTKMAVERIQEFTGTFKKFFGMHKKLICISLLTPCNTSLCQAVKVGSKLLPKEAYFSFLESNIIDSENKSFSELNDIFINVPLSSNKYGTLFKKGTKSIHPDSATDFQNLIDISTAETTFKTIVNITNLYHEKYSSTHNLAYHCKSGKDRTGICDSIVQATLYYLRTGGNSTNLDHELIRVYSRYFLVYSYIISFYSTGIPGIKINNIPAAKYILGDPDSYLYTFFLGNSHLSSS